MDLNSTIPLAIAAAFLAELVIVAPRAKSVCSIVSLVQTNLGTKSVCSLVTKCSNGSDYTNLDHSRSHKIEKKQKQKERIWSIFV